VDHHGVEALNPPAWSGSAGAAKSKPFEPTTIRAFIGIASYLYPKQFPNGL
jgi:hypothetical protein